MERETYYLNAKQVAERMGISLALSYKIIREWNESLKKQGRLVIRGRINRRFFEKQMES